MKLKKFYNKKFILLNYLFFLIVFAILFEILFANNLNAYGIDDFFKDLQVLNDPRMNIAQINAAKLRIKLFLNRTSFEDLFYQIYILTLELDKGEITDLLKSLKNSLPEKQYEKLIKMLKENSINNNSKDKKTNQSDKNNKKTNENSASTSTTQNTTSNNNHEQSQSENNSTPSNQNAPSTTNNNNSETGYETKQDTSIMSEKEKINNKKTYSYQELKQIFKNGYEQFYKKDYNKSLENFKIAYENNYNIISATYYIALIYEKRNNYKKASEFFEKTYSLSIKLYSLNYNFVSFILKKTGINYYKLNNFKKSLDYLLKSLEYNPSDGDTYYWIGLVYYNVKDNNHALAYWKKGSLLGNTMCIKSYSWLKDKTKHQN